MTIDNRYTTDIIVTNSGRLNIISGGNLQYDSQTGAYVRSGGRLHISNGGLMSKGVAVSDGIIHISSGGTLLKLWAVSQGGLVYVSNGGLMSSGYVSSGGQVHVNSGGTAVDVLCLSSGIIAVNSGGLALHPIVAGSMLVRGGRVFSGFLEGTVILAGSGSTLGYASDNVLRSGGVLNVLSGGKASATQFISGQITVSSGGMIQAPECGGIDSKTIDLKPGASAHITYLGSGAQMTVSSGATATTPRVSSGASMTVYGLALYNSVTGGRLAAGSGGIVSSSILSGGMIDVQTRGAADLTKISGGLLRVSGTAVDTIISGSGGTMTIMSGGFACGRDPAMNRMIDGKIYINSGGTASSFHVSGGTVTVQGSAVGNQYSGGYILISGGSSISEYLKGGIMHIRGGSDSTIRGTATKLDIQGGSAVLSSGAGITSASVYSGAMLYLYDRAENVYVQYGGTLRVESGGIHAGGTAYGSETVRNGGVASNVLIGQSNMMTIESGGVHISGKIWGSETVSAGGRVSALEFISGAGFILNGSADLCTVNAGASARISSGGVLTNGAAGSNAYIVVNAGGTATLTSANGPNMNVYGGSAYLSGGNAKNVMMSGGALELLSGALYTSAEIDSGYVRVGSGCVVSRTRIYGLGIDDPNPEHWISGYAEMVVFTGAKAVSCTVDGSRGYLMVNSGGTATNLQIGHSAGALIGGVIDECSIFSGASVELDSTGAVASRTKVRDMGTLNLYGGGSAYDTTVGSGGRLLLGKLGSATMVTVSSGTVKVSSGGLASNCTVDAGGVLDVSSGGRISGAKVLSGGKIAGDFSCTSVTFSNGAIVDFKISELYQPPQQALVKNLSVAMDKASFSLTTSLAMQKGTYMLADGAAGFDKTISVFSSAGDELGTLTVGKTVNIGNSGYTLNLSNDVLSVTVGMPGPDPGPEPASEAAKGDRDGNGVSDVMFVWTGEHGEGNHAHGYWMNGTSDWWSANAPGVSPDWDNLGSYDMSGDGKADAVMFGNVIVNEARGAYIGYYQDGNDMDGWVTIGFLDNSENIAWQNKVGNLTGNDSGVNSIVWYAPELYALGAWKDGTTEWADISHNFGGAEWKLAGCGDFDGDGRDSVLMTYNNGQLYYVIDIDGAAPKALGNSDWRGWDLRAIGDFSGDGRDDIVLFHEETGSMVMCANGNFDDFKSIGQLAANDWFVVGAGDYDGDAQDDLLVRQYSTGMLGYYICADQSQWVEMGRGVGMEWTVIA
jgi:autotransporter passenger strand-loop-strand repeat protein